MSVSEVRSLLVRPYVLVFVCSDMKGLQAWINSHSYMLMAEQHVLQQLLVCPQGANLEPPTVQVCRRTQHEQNTNSITTDCTSTVSTNVYVYVV